MSSQTIVNKDVIIERAKELGNMIALMDEVERFKQAEVKIKEHTQVQELINKIKGKQKELVAFKHLHHHKMIEKVEKELEELQDQLDGFPIVEEFKNTQLEINDLLQLVTNVIADTLSERVVVETGGEAGGCGTGGSCGCS